MRTFVALGAVAAALAATPAGAETVVKVGVVSSYSGFLAEAGDEMDKGFSLYLKEHLKDLPPGVTVELVKRDDAASAETGKRLAQELITREHVQILTGFVGSPIAAAVAPLTAQAKVPMVIMNAAGVAIPRISPYVVRVSFTLWQQGHPLGKWAREQGWKTAFTAVSDFIPGHDTEGAFTKGFTDAGGTIAQSIRFSPSSPDFVPVVQRIRTGVNVVSTQDLVDDVELANMGDAPAGLVSAGNYSAAAERPANAAFLAAWKRAYGDAVAPDFVAVGGWDGMAAIFDLIKATNGQFTGDEAMKFLANWKNPDSPRGPISIDPMTRDIVQNIYIRRTELRDGKLATVEFHTIPDVKDPWKELNPK